MYIYIKWRNEDTADRDVLRVGERTRVLRGPQGDHVGDIHADGKLRGKSRDTLGREVIVQKGGLV
jgi:hypothetical protein